MAEPTTQIISIATDADLVITVKEHNIKGNHVKTAGFRVKAATLSAGSPFFATLLSPGSGFKEAKTQKYELEEDTGVSVASIEILFRCLHLASPEAKSSPCPNTDHKSESPPDTGSMPALPPVARTISDMPLSTYDVSRMDVWNLLPLVNLKGFKCDFPGKYDVDSAVLKPWFWRWFSKNWFSTIYPGPNTPQYSVQVAVQELLFPCFIIGKNKPDEHFQLITKWLAYHGQGQICEENPLINAGALGEGFYNHLHMPKEVIAQLRVAKSALYNSIIDGYYDIHTSFLRATCDCRMDGFYAFLEASKKTGVFPFEPKFQSNNEVLQKLKEIKYTAPKGAEKCRTCGTRVVSKGILDVVSEIEGLFSGLSRTNGYTMKLHGREEEDY